MNNSHNGRHNLLNKKRKRKAVLLVCTAAFLTTIIFLISGHALFKEKTIQAGHVQTSIHKSKSPQILAHSTPIKAESYNLNAAYPSNSIYKPDGHKIAFLTFDDGPTGKVTPKILDTLQKYHIKGTFFVIGQMALQNKDILMREWSEGHVIGNHTYSHDYKYLYLTPENLIGDLDKDTTTIQSIIPTYTNRLIRFPGGSFGKERKTFREAVIKAGYHFVDWNALNGDAEGKKLTAEALLVNVQKTTLGKDHVVILMHDAADKETTAEALPQIIEYLQAQGYTFETIQ